MSKLPPEADEFFSFSREGYCEEPQQVAAIKKWLRSPEDRAWMNENDLSIEDILNGRFNAEHEKYILPMFARWNDLIGRRIFGM